jgi:hypothetical protein
MLKEKTKTEISHNTVRNVLNENNLYVYSSIKKPHLSKNILQVGRKKKTGKMLALSDYDIETIIFSDES